MNLLFIKCKWLPSYNSRVVPPLGIMYIASYIRKWKSSLNIKIIDLRLSNGLLSKDLDNIVKEFSPHVVGISALTVESNNMHEVADVVKTSAPYTRIVVGGPHATAYTEDVLKDRNIDYVVLGEGEETFKEILEAFENKKEIKDVKGIAFRDGDKVYRTPLREYMINLDMLSFPSWDLINLDEYSKHKSMSLLGRRRYMTLFTSRACPFRCIYCHNMFGKGFRARSPENVLAEIDILYNKYEIKEYEIIDDIFNLDVQRAERICDLIIERGYKIGLSFPNGLRSDRLDRNLLKKLKMAGTKFIAFAVESGSSRIQKLIKKNLNLEKVDEAIRNGVELGIFSHGFFMLGFPTETENEVKQTIKFALKSKLHTAFFFKVIPFQDTELFNMVKENFCINFTDYNYIKSNFNLSNVEDKKLQDFIKYAYLRFYFSPIRILRIPFVYLKIENLHTLFSYFIGLIRFLFIQATNRPRKKTFVNVISKKFAKINN